MKNTSSIKWFLSLIVGASLITFTMTGCGGDEVAVEETVAVDQNTGAAVVDAIAVDEDTGEVAEVMEEEAP